VEVGSETEEGSGVETGSTLELSTLDFILPKVTAGIQVIHIPHNTPETLSQISADLLLLSSIILFQISRSLFLIQSSTLSFSISLIALGNNFLAFSVDWLEIS
jgi:hypothetical protein